MQARLSRQRLGWKPCLGESKAASAQNRLAQNQNCIRLGLGRFSEVPINAFTRLFIAILWMVVIYCDVLAMDLISVYFNE